MSIADGVIDCEECATLIIENHGTEKLRLKSVLGVLETVDVLPSTGGTGAGVKRDLQLNSDHSGGPMAILDATPSSMETSLR